MFCADSGWDIVAIIVVTNVALSALHALFTWAIKQSWSQSFTWDDRILTVLEFLLKMLNWLMANRRNPPK